MSGSQLTPFNFIPENSLATPGLWNSVFSTLSQNIAEANTLASVLTGGISLGTQGLTINVPSNATDYIFLNDSANLRSSYVIGSFNSGTADGLNIWDASGQTMIVSFSKQSVRFFQQVVGPVFDVGGALASTLNAATFGGSLVTTQIQAAISAASNAIPKIKRVYVPASMYPYDPRQMSFDTNVQMVREGGAWDVYDVQAYGAYGDNSHDDLVAFQAAISAATWVNGNVFVPNTAAGYKITSTLTLGPNIDVGSGAGYQPTLHFSNVSGTLMSFLGTAEAQPFNTKVHNLTLTNSTNTSGNAIRLRNFENAYLSELVISNWSLGVWADWGIGVYVDKCAVNTNNRGIMLAGPGLAGGIRSTNSSFMDTTVINETAFAANRYDIVHHGSNYAEGVLNVYGCSFFESAGALVSGKTEYVHMSNLKCANIIGNWFESPAVGRSGLVFTNVDSDGSATTLCNGGFVANNDFLSTGASGTNGIVVERANGIFITGNNFEFPVGTGTPILLSEQTYPSTVIGNAYLTWADVVGYTNPIVSTNSVHQIIEKSNITSSLGTTIFQGIVSVGTGIANVPTLTHGSNRSTGWYMPAAGTINWTGVGLGVNKTSGLGATLHVGGTGLFDSVVRGPNATALTPTWAFSSEQSLGWYFSGTSNMALSYGTLDLRTTTISLSSIFVKSGTNNSCGTAVLGSNGSVNVANTYVKTGDLIFLTDQTPGGTLGDLEVGGIRNASGFTIQSTSITDTSTVGWLIIRPT